VANELVVGTARGHGIEKTLPGFHPSRLELLPFVGPPLSLFPFVVPFDHEPDMIIVLLPAL
jgi:hypothetical protein